VIGDGDDKAPAPALAPVVPVFPPSVGDGECGTIGGRLRGGVIRRHNEERALSAAHEGTETFEASNRWQMSGVPHHERTRARTEGGGKRSFHLARISTLYKQ